MQGSQPRKGAGTQQVTLYSRVTLAHIGYAGDATSSGIRRSVQGTLGITALSLQVLLFYGEGPAAVKLVYDRTPSESGEFLHALVVESRHTFRISLISSFCRAVR